MAPRKGDPTGEGSEQSGLGKSDRELDAVGACKPTRGHQTQGLKPIYRQHMLENYHT